MDIQMRDLLKMKKALPSQWATSGAHGLASVHSRRGRGKGYAVTTQTSRNGKKVKKEGIT